MSEVTLKSICANCNKPIEQRFSDTLQRTVIVHSGLPAIGGKFCYRRGSQYASFPVIHETPELFDTEGTP